MSTPERLRPINQDNVHQLSKRIIQMNTWIYLIFDDDHRPVHEVHGVCKDKQSRSETKLEPQSSFKFQFLAL